MILAFLEPVFAFIEPWFLFYPVCLLLLVAGVCCLPGDGQTKHDYKEGVPVLSFLCNLVLFAIVIQHFDIGFPFGPLWWIALSLVYLLTGTVWSFYKWRHFVVLVRDNMVSSFQEWCLDHDVNYLALRRDLAEDSTRLEFYNWVRTTSGFRCYPTAYPPLKAKPEQETVDVATRYGNGKVSEKQTAYYPCPFQDLVNCLIPQVLQHKSYIVTALTCWPMSVLKYLFANFMTDLINFIVNSLKRQFQFVADQSFKDLS